MRVSLVNGVFVLPDAISYCIQTKIRALKLLAGDSVEYRIFCYGTNSDDPHVRVVSGSADLARDSFFLNSDVVFFEFGIYFDLFNAIFLLPAETKKIVTWHNITPERLLTDPRAIENVRKGFAQRSNLRAADHIFADSRHNRQDLLEYGIDPRKADVLPIPLKETFPPVHSHRLRSPEGPVQALFVGRFVPSKGLLDAVESVSAAIRDGAKVRLTLIGDLTFSDPAYIADVRRAIAESPNPEAFLFAGTVSDEELVRWYYASDILLMASYHEGFGVPIIEGLACGCIPVTYDAGNLPDTVHNLGRVVPTGNRELLTQAIVELCRDLTNSPGSVMHLDCGAVTPDQYARQVSSYLSFYSWETFLSRFEYLLRDRAGIRFTQFPPLSAVHRETEERRAPLVKAVPGSAGHPSVCYFDLRILQRENTRHSPAARFLVALLRYRPAGRPCYFAALFDPDSGQLPHEILPLVDGVFEFASFNPSARAVFIAGSTVSRGEDMGRWSSESVFSVVLARDFVADWVSLAEPPSGSVNLAPRLAVDKFDAVMPVTPAATAYAADVLRLPGDKILCAGELSSSSEGKASGTGTAFVVRADFAASRLEIAVAAFGRFMARSARRTRSSVLRIAGTVSEDLQSDLRRIAGQHASAVEFVEGSWGQIAKKCLTGASVCLIPSAQDEARESLFDAIGVDVPVIAASGNTRYGFDLPSASVFSEGEADQLAECMTTLAESSSVRNSVLTAQQKTVRDYRPAETARRAWDLISRAWLKKFGSRAATEAKHLNA